MLRVTMPNSDRAEDGGAAGACCGAGAAPGSEKIALDRGADAGRGIGAGGA